MRRLLAAAYIVVLLVVSQAAILAAGESLTVKFGKKVYDRGDVVSFTVSGFTGSKNIAVEVYAPGGGLVWIHEEDDVSSPVSFTFKLPDAAPEGEYTVYIALSGSKPQKFSFTVHRPEFSIVKLEAPKTAYTGSAVTVTVTVKNKGALGSFEIRIVDSNGNIVAREGPVGLDYNGMSIHQLGFNVPTSEGTYTYKVEVYNVKYEVVDDSREFSITVKAPPAPSPTPTPTSPPPPPVAPPVPPAPPPTTTTPTTTTPTTTTTPVVPPTTAKVTQTTPPKGAAAAYVADVSAVVSPTGIVVKPVAVVVPELKVRLVIPSGVQVLSPTGAPVAPKKIIVAVLKTAPSPTAPEARVVGTPVNITTDIGSIVFTRPVTVEVPFNPAMVPPGFAVRLAYYNTTMGKWVPLPTVRVDSVRGVVVGLTKHFTVFAAVAYRVAVPVTTTTPTATATVTVTKPVTVTATKTVTRPATTTTTTTTATVTWTATSTVTVTSTTTKTVVTPVTLVSTTTTTATITKTRTLTQLLPVTTTKVYTVTATETRERTITVTATPATVTSIVTLTSTITKARTPGWAYASLAAIVVLVVAVMLLALRLSRYKA